MQLEFDFDAHKNQAFLDSLIVPAVNTFMIGEQVKLDIWYWKIGEHREEVGEIVDIFQYGEYRVRVGDTCYLSHANHLKRV